MRLSEAVGKGASEAGGCDGLHRERRVPQLGAVIALHLEAVLRDPQVVGHAREVALEGLAVGVVKPAAHHVDDLGAPSGGERQGASLDGERQGASLNGERQGASLGGERQGASLGGERQGASLDGERQG
eukprot:130874-Chlamydomonas_euryale.AAC.1